MNWRSMENKILCARLRFEIQNDGTIVTETNGVNFDPLGFDL